MFTAILSACGQKETVTEIPDDEIADPVPGLERKQGINEKLLLEEKQTDEKIKQIVKINFHQIRQTMEQLAHTNDDWHLQPLINISPRMKGVSSCR